MSDYRPQVIHYDGEGDPYWQFVERDVPTVTGQVFAANVEMIMDFDGTVIGFNIYDQAPASTDTDTAELVAAFRAYIAACSGAGTTLYDGHPAVLMSKGVDHLTALERERDETRAQLRTSEVISAAHADDTQEAAALWRAATGELTAYQAEVERLKEALKGLENPWVQFINCWADPSGDPEYDTREERDNVKVLSEAMDRAHAALQPQVGK